MPAPPLGRTREATLRNTLGSASFGDPGRGCVVKRETRSSIRLQSAPIAWMGKGLGALAYCLDRRHRRIIRRNLAFAYPQWSRRRVRHVTRLVYAHMGSTLLEILQMASLTREQVLERVRIRGQEHLVEAARHPCGAIIISAHLGNWEMASLCGACFLNKPIVVVARRIRPSFLERWVLRLRTRFGNQVLDKRRALPRMARTLRRGGTLGILIDQSTRRAEGVEVRFFGRRATATPAAALLARRYGSPVVPAFCVREADGGLSLVAYPPLKLQVSEDPAADIRANTQVMTDAVERAIRDYPEQWFWFHKRWKRHHPELYPEDLARQTRRQTRKVSSQREDNG